MRLADEWVKSEGLSTTDWEEKTPIDYFFAKRLAPHAEEPVFHFLAGLLKAAREGHLCVESNIELPRYLFEEALVEENGRIYLRRNWECEQLFLKHYRRLKNERPAIPIPEFHVEALEPEQKQAIYNVAARSLSLICGGPGTGKTFTAATLIRNFLPHLEPVVAAPTGKAAANLRRALEGICPVVTLHALLKRRYLAADLVLVDEASMIDAELMAALFSSIKQGARLVLIGDRDQLPPVETGQFFADLAEDHELVVELGKCRRAELKEIVDMARAVKEGKPVPTLPMPGFETIAQAVFERNACVLTPLRHVVDSLNKKLLKRHLEQGGRRFPIMVRVNDPPLELYNGDVGVVVADESCAYFGERKVPDYLLPHYEYAYVISVHKSQGSEYDEVIVLLPEGSEAFGREMLYTAITRAKKRVEIYAVEGILSQILSKRERRLSGIKTVVI
ncbi:MAG: AAA family ATPase [Chlamydiales bacterium]|nr:AAA family ATPase [Chlamydiales bacterium]